MRTAIDSNILSAFWSNEASAGDIEIFLGNAKQSGALLISGAVYAELLAYPGATESFLNDFCHQTGITIDFRFQDSIWIEAGKRYGRYANRRRKTSGEHPKRLLADFIVGSHAMHQADRLLTLDPKRYKQDFPELLLSDPKHF
jgi:predicted nucleic acid-binding protein